MSYSKPYLSYLAFKSGNPIYLFHSFECIQRSQKNEKLLPTAFCLIEFWQNLVEFGQNSVEFWQNVGRIELLNIEVR